MHIRSNCGFPMPRWTSWVVINPDIKFYSRPPIDPSKNGSGPVATPIGKAEV